MHEPGIHVVTGAFGYSGKYIARRLLEAGRTVRTLTNSLHRPDPFAGQVQAAPFHFDRPERLTESLRGAEVLYNTYWIRFNHRGFTFADAVANSRALIRAARTAGVRRVVHVSITNPSADSSLEYFRGKAEVEAALVASGLSHAILRPAVLFGHEDILVNNIAWSLRKFPVFPIFGDGQYRLRPIHVEDLAELAVREGMETADRIIDAVGPETFTYRELAGVVGRIIGKPRRMVSVPPLLGWLGSKVIGKAVGDVMLTRDEIRGLMAELLWTDSRPAGTTRLTDWARRHADTLGVHYASELGRRR